MVSPVELRLELETCREVKYCLLATLVFYTTRAEWSKTNESVLTLMKVQPQPLIEVAAMPLQVVTIAVSILRTHRALVTLESKGSIRDFFSK